MRFCESFCLDKKVEYKDWNGGEDGVNGGYESDLGFEFDFFELDLFVKLKF